MSKHRIPYLSTQAASDLWDRRFENEPKYLAGNFEAELSVAGAVMELPIEYDQPVLMNLDAAKTELENSLLVWEAFNGLTPRLACENRIWTCICHGVCLEFSRSRWLTGKSGTELSDQAGKHLFARTQTMYRDDNAISRLWWSAFAANQADPSNFEESLGLILKTADIRSNFIERPWMTTRPSVAKAILRAMKSDDWVTAAEVNFRETMKSLNISGAGIAFEVIPDGEADKILSTAIDNAKILVGGF